MLVNVAADRASKSKKSVQDELDAITERLAKLEAPSVNSAAVCILRVAPPISLLVH